MHVKRGKYSRVDLVFILILLMMVGLYAVYLFSFTVFDGFSTFSNDAGGYVLLARKWSPYIEPTLAEMNTWSVVTYPPGFPWVLALTGTDSSLQSAHMFVSICMLAGIFLAGWAAYRKLGWFNGGLLTLAFCLLPGVLVSSLGILSENLYMVASFSALLLYAHIKQQSRAGIVSFLFLLLFLLLGILTRSIGIALVMAIAVVPFFDGEIPRKLKIHLVLLAGCTLVLWQLWGFFDPQSSESTYGDFFALAVGGMSTESGGVLMGFVQVINTNLIQIFISFNQYLSLGHPNPLFFIASFLLFLASIAGIAYRLYYRKLDAVYLLFYFGIILIWPYPDQMMRFLHPVIFLLILQAALLFHELAERGNSQVTKLAIAAVAVVLIINSIIIQQHLLEIKDNAIDTRLRTAHTYEYYHRAFDEMGVKYATAYTGVMNLMRVSAGRIPQSSVVASVKHEFFSILADREAVNLVAVVSPEQQLCNLKIRDVEVIFLSGLTTSYNTYGIQFLERFEKISSEVWSPKSEDGVIEARVIFIDRMKLDAELSATSYDCRIFKQNA